MLKEKIKKWLGIGDLETLLKHDVKTIKELFQASNKRSEKIEANIKDICDNAIMGVDLCYKSESALIIIKYSRVTNSFKVIEDSKCIFPSYRDMVFKLRHWARAHRVDILCMNEPVRDHHPDIPVSERILPQRNLADYYQNR